MNKKKLIRSKALAYFAKHAIGVVAIEARDTSHYWARKIEKLVLWINNLVLIGCGSSDSDSPQVKRQTLNIELDYAEYLQGTTFFPYAFRVADSDKFNFGLADLPSPFEFRMLCPAL